jgi:hypothetical protein
LAYGFCREKVTEKALLLTYCEFFRGPWQRD